MGSSFLQSKNENHRNSITKQNLNQKTSSTSQSRVPRNAAIEYFDTKQAEYTTKAFSSFGNNTAGDFSRSPQADTGKQTPFTQVQLNNKNNSGIIQSFQAPNNTFKNLGVAVPVFNETVESQTFLAQSQSSDLNNNNLINVGVTASTTTIPALKTKKTI